MFLVAFAIGAVVAVAVVGAIEIAIVVMGAVGSIVVFVGEIRIRIKRIRGNPMKFSYCTILWARLSSASRSRSWSVSVSRSRSWVRSVARSQTGQRWLSHSWSRGLRSLSRSLSRSNTGVI